jgi:hypothetical protein
MGNKHRSISHETFDTIYHENSNRRNGIIRDLYIKRSLINFKLNTQVNEVSLWSYIEPIKKDSKWIYYIPDGIDFIQDIIITNNDCDDIKLSFESIHNETISILGSWNFKLYSNIIQPFNGDKVPIYIGNKCTFYFFSNKKVKLNVQLGTVKQNNKIYKIGETYKYTNENLETVSFKNGKVLCLSYL